LFFMYCATSSIWSDYPGVSLRRWVRAFGDLVMVLVILSETDWVSAFKRVLARLGFVLLPLSVLFIRYFPAWGRGYNVAGTATYWSGVTSDKNGLGMICLTFGFGGIWRFLEVYHGKKDRWRANSLIARGLLAAVTIYLLWESHSKTAQMCFLIAIGL